MILTKTPLRVSFVGGGTDFEPYYRDSYGAVVSTTVDKFVYVAVNEKFDDDVRVSYSETENVTHASQIAHNTIRESLKFCGIENKIEVVTVSDVPGRGTGLGSSSSLTVGTLNALYSYLGYSQSPETLARDACLIEIKKLKNPIGKQDQFAAAYGGLNYIRFNPHARVLVEPIQLTKSRRKTLQNNLLYFYTGITRDSSSILKTQRDNIEEKRHILNAMRDAADEARLSLHGGDFENFAKLLSDGWARKRELANGITNPLIENYYEKAMEAGALGGKINGAGGGGFFTFYVEPEKQEKVVKALSPLKKVDMLFEEDGTQVVLNE